MAKNDELFEVDFGDPGATSMIQSDVTQSNIKTVDDQGQSTTKKNSDSEFELVENLLDNDGKDTKDTKEDVEEDSKEKTEKSPPSANDTQDASSFAFVFAKVQQEEGNLSFDLDEKELKEIVEKDGEAAAITYLFDKEVEYRASKLKEMYEGDVKEYIELKDAGVDPDVAKRLVELKGKFESITNEQIEDEKGEDIRRNILIQNYKNTTSLEDAKIKKLVDRSIASGDDIEEAKEALEAIKKFNKEQVELERKKVVDEEKAQAEASKSARENMIKKIAETNEILPGYQLTKGVKKEIEKMILEPVKKTKDGRVLNGVWAKFNESPETSLLKLAFLMHSGIWDGKLDKLEKTAKTQAIKNMEDVIRSKGNAISNKGKSTASSDNEDTLTSMKDIFKI